MGEIEDKIVNDMISSEDVQLFNEAYPSDATGSVLMGTASEASGISMEAKMEQAMAESGFSKDDLLDLVMGVSGGGSGKSLKVGIRGAKDVYKKISNILSDQTLLNPKVKGPGTFTIQHVMNNLLEHLGKKGTYRQIGTYSSKKANYDISVTNESISNISDKGIDLIKRLKTKFPNASSYDESMLMKVIKGSKRPAKIVKIVNRDNGQTIFQPFYKSTGRGEPSIRSAEKWLPFEGVLPNKHFVTITSRGMKAKYKAKDAMWKHDFKPGEAPVGWVIKGVKQPIAPGKIFSSSNSGKVKEGFHIHQEITKMLKEIE